MKTNDVIKSSWPHLLNHRTVIALLLLNRGDGGNFPLCWNATPLNLVNLFYIVSENLSLETITSLPHRSKEINIKILSLRRFQIFMYLISKLHFRPELNCWIFSQIHIFSISIIPFWSHSARAHTQTHTHAHTHTHYASEKVQKGCRHI